MKIYVIHSSSFNYQTELYQPLRQSELNQQHEIVLPHEYSSRQFKSKEFLKKCDLVLAEVSYPSTGSGIELGWADIYKIPIVYFHKKGSKTSSSLRTISKKFITYETAADMISKLTNTIQQSE